MAGPLTSLALAIAAGLVVRSGGLGGEALRVVTTFAYTNASLFVFHLLPIPGLDGGRLLTMLLPPHARETFRNADRYLPLFVLVVLFVLFSVLFEFVQLITGAICDAASGSDCLTLLLLA